MAKKIPNPTKLTLRLDEGLIDRAKSYAQEQDRSLSQLVADYFAHLTVKSKTTSKTRLAGNQAVQAPGPITAGLRGALLQVTGKVTPGKAPKGRDDYRAHLEEKYL